MAGRQRAGAGTLLVEAVGAAALDIAAADHEIGCTGLQQRQHFRQLRLVMLQVGIDHGGAWRARCQNALDAGPRQAAPSDPPDAANPRILTRQIADFAPARLVLVDHWLRQRAIEAK